MFCPKCGRELKDTAKFCSKCGISLLNAISKRKTSWESKKNIIFIMVVCLVFICGGFGFAKVVQNTDRKVDAQMNTSNSYEKLSEVEIPISTPESTGELLFDELETKDLVNSEGLVEVLEEEIEREKISIWFDGIEFKILEFGDNGKMAVKFSLGNYLIQMVIPNSLELDKYMLTESYSETYGGMTETCEYYVHEQKKTALYVSIVSGKDIESVYQETFDQMRNREDFTEFQTISDCRGFFAEGAMYVARDEYDEESSLDGYMVSIFDAELQVILSIILASEDLTEGTIFKENIQQIVFRKQKDSDFVYRSSNQELDYEQRMEAMYQKYINIVDNPTDYLSTNYQAVGEGYEEHYLYDLTNDGIPEIIYFGYPQSICIVGEKNAVNLEGYSIYWGNETGVFYTSMFGLLSGWSKYKIVEDEEGYIELHIEEENYLVEEAIYMDSLDLYTYQKYYCGEKISDSEFERIAKEINSPYIPGARMYGVEYIAAKGGFQKSVKKLSDDYLYVVD